MSRIDEQDRGDFLVSHPDWALENESISRTYEFSDFGQAMGFVTRVAIAAEVADHHPDIDIRWNKVTLVLSTHSEGALTSKDTELAGQLDGFFAD
jgi:4a-hydroxytetrahydrobiopterin dehydratase